MGEHGGKHLVTVPALRWATVALSLFSFHCINRPAEPLAPRWDVDVTAPVSDKTYSLQEIVDKDSSIVQAEPGGTQLMLKTSVVASPAFVGDRLSLDPIQSSFQAVLGPFTVRPSSYTLSIPIPGMIPGVRTVVPPLSPVSLASVSGDLPYLDQVVLQSGTVRLSIRNKLPVLVRIEAPIALENSSGNPIAMFDLGTAPLSPGEERTATADVAGKTVPKHVTISGMRISSPGSGGTTVTLPDTLLAATISAEHLVATEAVLTDVPAQHVDVSRSLALNSQTLVKQVWVNRGSFNLHIVNNIDLGVDFSVRLPEVVGPSGQAFRQNLTLSPRSTVDLAFDLGRYRLASQTGGFLRCLQAECTADVQGGSTGRAVTIRSTDFVNVNASSSSLIADSIVAAIKPTLLTVDERVALKLGDITRKFKGYLEIPAAQMRFSPRVSLDLPMDINLKFEARDASGRVVTLPVPVQKASRGLSVIEFAQGDVGSFLSQVSGQLPDSLRVTGSITLNPEYDTLTVTSIGRNCSFGGSVDVAVPLRLQMRDGFFSDILAIGDTTADGVSDHRIDPKTIAQMKHGRMYVQIENSLPLQVALKVNLLNRNKQDVLTLPQTSGDSVRVAAGAVANGDVVSATSTLVTIDLQKSEIDQFNVADFVKLAVGVATPGSGPVNFRTTDKVRIRVWTNFSYGVNQ